MNEPSLRGLSLFSRGEQAALIERIVRSFRGEPVDEEQPDEPVDRVPSDEIAAAVKEFAKSLSFELYVPGTHYSGLANQDLLDILASQGRDFGAPSKELSDYVAETLLDEFGDGDTLPDEDRMRAVAADAILEWIVGRFNEEHDDVDLAALSPAYLEIKAARGLDERIGIATGELLAAVQDRGRVVIE